MSYRVADVSKATGKGGMWGVEYIRLGMGLFVSNAVIGPVGSVSVEAAVTENRLLCFGVNNQSYICDSGHCCGESQCCSYYYEVWWFWLVLTLIIILGCCCLCHHRRAKHRLQQQQRQHEINLIAYREAHNYTSLPFYFRFLPGYLLPAYEEVENRPPTPPPPYSASQPGQSTSPVPLCSEQPDELCPALQCSPVASASENCSPGPCIEQPHSPTSHCPTRNTHKPYLSLEEDGQLQQVACATSHSLVKQSSEDLTKAGEQGLDCSPDINDKTPGRHRRFTGDSGIEVCVCSQGPGDGEEEEEMKELVGHLEGGLLEEQDFCDSCNPRSSSPHGLGVEEQGLATSDREPQRPPVCLHLHTINEQEGQHHGNHDPQS